MTDLSDNLMEPTRFELVEFASPMPRDALRQLVACHQGRVRNASGGP